MTLIEKILAGHSGKSVVKPGDIIDVFIDIRAARDFGGANVIKNLKDNNLDIEDTSKTYFTFDCNPSGSDQAYAANQHLCRVYARDRGMNIYDINSGIGTHLAMDNGLVYPGCTFVSTDSHANILGSIGAFGQGMGDMDIAATFAKGSVWFKVPESVKLKFTGRKAANISAKDIVLNLLAIFGANSLLGYSVELSGDAMDKLTLDERITISSMATEMGAIILLFTPNKSVMEYCKSKSGKDIEFIEADQDAKYAFEKDIEISSFVQMVSKPGNPEDAVPVDNVKKIKIDSCFIGSCTNGRMEDLQVAAKILKGKKVAPGVVLKIVPATDEIWKECLKEGLISIFKNSGAMVANAGCAGCAAGQVGQNGPGEITLSTGNRNFAGKQGKGEVYLASPSVVAASAVAGYITTENEIPAQPLLFSIKSSLSSGKSAKSKVIAAKPVVAEGRVWFIRKDNIDTDMIFHNRHLTITNIDDMGQHTFGNLKGYEDFAGKAQKGDIVIAAKNFGAGSSRQQAVDCFLSLGIQCIIAESFGAIYERNAINAALPVMTYHSIDALEINDGDKIKVNFETGEIVNLENNISTTINKFSEVQMEIYKNGGLL